VHLLQYYDNVAIPYLKMLQTTYQDIGYSKRGSGILQNMRCSMVHWRQNVCDFKFDWNYIIIMLKIVIYKCCSETTKLLEKFNFKFVECCLRRIYDYQFEEKS